MVDRLIPAVIVLALLAVLLLGMWLAWRARTARDSGVPAGIPIPADGIHPVVEAGVLYVATTKAGEPLERLAIRGLAFRARADLTVATEGVVLSVPGQEPVFIGSEQLLAVRPATWTIDRVVESDGLIAISWRSAKTDVDSYVRVIDPTQHSRVLNALSSLPTAPAQPAPTDSTESEK